MNFNSIISKSGNHPRENVQLSFDIRPIILEANMQDLKTSSDVEGAVYYSNDITVTDNDPASLKLFNAKTYLNILKWYAIRANTDMPSTYLDGTTRALVTMSAVKGAILGYTIELDRADVTLNPGDIFMQSKRMSSSNLQSNISNFDDITIDEIPLRLSPRNGKTTLFMLPHNPYGSRVLVPSAGSLGSAVLTSYGYAAKNKDRIIVPDIFDHTSISELSSPSLVNVKFLGGVSASFVIDSVLFLSPLTVTTPSDTAANQAIAVAAFLNANLSFLDAGYVAVPLVDTVSITASIFECPKIYSLSGCSLKGISSPIIKNYSNDAQLSHFSLGARSFLFSGAISGYRVRIAPIPAALSDAQAKPILENLITKSFYSGGEGAI